MPRFFAPCIAIGICLLTYGCTTTSETKPSETAPIVGNDTDQHGCKASAGYQWSVVRNACLQVFTTGIRLDPQAPGSNKTLSAFVVFASDTSDAQAELFLPNQARSILLNKAGDKDDAGTWKNDTLTLSQWKGMYSLDNARQQTLYQGHPQIPADEAAETDTIVGINGADKARVQATQAPAREFVYRDYKVRTEPNADQASEQVKVYSLKGEELWKLTESEATSFAGLSHNNVLIDKGTGPDGRELAIYDLATRKLGLRAAYIGELAISAAGVLTFYAPVTKRQVTKQPNCPEQAAWRKNGFTIGYGQLSLYDLTAGKLATQNEFTCFPLQ